MIIDMEKYKLSLADLWNEVFGDTYGYINRIFKEEYKNDIICFGEKDDEKVVSAFYLLKNSLRFEGRIYNGFYLYSAATLPQYRKRGLMGKLIKEAQGYCEEQGCDYISLVPAEDELYNYYEKFGFCEAMHYWNNACQTCYDENFSLDRISDVSTINDMRRNYDGNMFQYEGKAYEYVTSVLKSESAHFYKISETGCCLFGVGDAFALEFITNKDNVKNDLEKMLKTVKEPFCIIWSPFEMSEYSILSYPKKFGMIYPINNELKRDWKYTDIYMNLALN